ncbi:MAG: V-type ATP synthase subunit I [Ruminococcaceae bacterium]|nr:V-type ATP synthase subunit I [Oscillospiraceae bacterium]
MAIVKMKKLTLIGLNTEKESILNDLMWLSAVDVTPLTEAGLEDLSGIVRNDGAVLEDESYGEEISLLDSAMKLMGMNHTAKKAMFAPKEKVYREDFDDSVFKTTVKEAAEKAISLQGEINVLKTSINRVQQSISALKPWVSLPTPLGRKPSKHTSQILGTVYDKVRLEDIMEIEVDGHTETTPVWAEKVNSNNKISYITVIYLDAYEKQLESHLAELGFSRIQFPGFNSTAADSISQLEGELSELKEKKEELEKELQDISNENYDKVRKLIDILTNKRKLSTVRSSLVMTGSSFMLEGWLPEDREGDVSGLLDKYTCYYETAEPADEEEPPIKLKNHAVLEPFEAITEMYSLPNYRGIDPTFMVAPFYFLLFGMMLSDAGYGIVMTIACFLGLKFLSLGKGLRGMLKMFMFCGISTTFWGFMFGTFFGDAVGVVSSTYFGSDLVLKPVWFDPVSDPITMLIVSFVVGFLHILAGLGIKGYMMIKRGNWLDALFDVGFWMILLIGLPLLILGGVFSVIGAVFAIGGAVGLIATQGRSEQNIFKKIASGVMSLYDVINYLADVLSYSRILALGLSTGVIGGVFNKLGSLGGSGFISAIVFVIVFILGHVLNFALCALGSYVHASRLQFIEFFGKFYEAGGRKFNALGVEGKYTDIL